MHVDEHPVGVKRDHFLQLPNGVIVPTGVEKKPTDIGGNRDGKRVQFLRPGDLAQRFVMSASTSQGVAEHIPAHLVLR